MGDLLRTIPGVTDPLNPSLGEFGYVPDSPIPKFLGELAMHSDVAPTPIPEAYNSGTPPNSQSLYGNLRDFGVVMTEVAMSFIFGDDEVPRSQLTSGDRPPDIII